MPKVSPDYGFAGMRLLYEFPYPRSWEELVVFQGASYFRFPAPGQVFGLSARGIAINTADKKAPEEFPAFSQLWVVEPEEGAKEVTVYALLDGRPSQGRTSSSSDLSPAQQRRRSRRRSSFASRPSEWVMRRSPAMFWYGENNYRKFPDYRPEVHDSGRPPDPRLLWHAHLAPPTNCDQGSRRCLRFTKVAQGFGLLQRDREYSSSVDIRAIYHRRPSLWVEPSGLE